ncbi:hypothetical protein AMAG_10836 [Allomyces macrogynus ATCC 38327]|uniref:Methyltransferase type 11 domain-containing protein n=1 Tax=Allomyces macrogynus (strain ATCC 38327) TaxID=578462 RepID=A0A0L0SS45_ALLM3|nr:hypothetical protein AMAG_10836 [Allomyces macrogynus ATCC 38327]|eukprot:KNE65184.1 hypothetical protein AMAG_10836 [Allomyces macrogynus ATCC 38327]
MFANTVAALARRAAIRTLAPSATLATGAPIVFDRNAKKLQRDRAAKHPNARQTDYLKDEVAHRIVERILDVKDRYPTIVDIGAGAVHLAKHLDQDITNKVIMCDVSRDLLYRDADFDGERGVEIERRVLDEETELLASFSENSVDMIISNMSMHWVNDLPGVLIQARKCLKPDHVFIGAMIGGESLFELRTVDVDEIVVDYPSMFKLIDDLHAMGESNVVLQRRSFLHRDTLLAASSIYQQLHGNPDGTVPATFQIIYLIGWKPSPTQPAPLERGSAKISLKKMLEE